MGILKGTLDDALSKRLFSKFYPHNIGHWLGIDVHDTPLISTSTQLEPNMVITIEPGLYINAADDVPSKYHDIGIRIEDDVVITNGAPIVLTKDVPKSIEEIEALRNEALSAP